MSAAAEGQRSPRDAAQGLLLGLAAAALWVTYLASRASTVDAFGLVAAAGCAALAAGPACIALQRPRGDARQWTLLIAVVLGSLPTGALAVLLKEKTHHRPLGGVTFALLALVCVIASVVVVRRLGVLGAGRSWSGGVARGAGLLAVLAVAGLSLLALEGGAGWVRLGLHGVVLGGCIAVADRIRGRVRTPRFAGSAWLVVVVLGLGSAVWSPQALLAVLV